MLPLALALVCAAWTPGRVPPIEAARAAAARFAGEAAGRAAGRYQPPPDIVPRPPDLDYLTLDLGGGVALTLVRIPAGAFIRGSPEGEPGRRSDEAPHPVTISRAFYLGVREVTQAQYQAVMDANPSLSRGAARPVENVSWQDAMDFCRRARLVTGEWLRLPTEAEWEYACRAGTATAYHAGDALEGHQAAFRNRPAVFSAGGGRVATFPAGSFPPNAWGLHDMHGNVWEWCSDYYGAYADHAQVDPSGPFEGALRVVRGGAWNQDQRRGRSASRGRLPPDTRDDSVGFRVALGHVARSHSSRIGSPRGQP